MITPIVTKDTNVKYVLDGCSDLPATQAYDENGIPYMITAWEIPLEDLKKLNETGIIYLSFMGTTIPPVLLEVNNPIIGGEENGNHDDSGQG